VRLITTGKAALFPFDSPAMQAPRRAYEKGWGATPVFTRGGGSIPVVAEIADLMGIPVVLMGYGLDDDGLHSPNERFSLEMFQRGIETTIVYLEEIRFIFSSFVANFQAFGVVAVVLIAMMGAGVAEESGMMNALIRKLVAVSPAALLAFIIIVVGVLSSVATDAGYLILIPLGAAAFMSMKRHPIAGVAAAFAGVSAIFGVNVLITPLDAMLTEITNEAIGLTGGEPITVVANYFFGTASVILMSIVAVIVTQRIIEPRLGTYQSGAEAQGETSNELSDTEKRGLKGSLYGFLAVAAVVLLFTLPPNAPLRDPATGAIIGNTPFMDSLIFIIALIFLVSGIGYGIGAKTFTGSNDVIKAVTKTFSGLAGPPVHVLDDQPVHRLFQLHQHSARIGCIAGQRPRTGRHRPFTAPGRPDCSDHLTQLHPTGGYPEVGDFCPDLHSPLCPVGGGSTNCFGCLSGRGFADECDYAADGLSTVRPHGCAAL
jgi:hypothetical protein